MLPAKVSINAIYPDEPSGPILKTDGLGPQNAKEIQKLKDVFETRYANFVVDYEKSIGNYICDADGNYYLDVFQQIASIALGYNNPDLREVAQSEDMVSALINRASTGRFPPKWYGRALREGIVAAAPEHQDKVWICLSGSDANDNAIKAAFMHYKSKQRGYDKPFSQEEMETVMEAKAPGNPDLGILSFNGSFHGRTIGSGSLTAARAYHKIDLPAFNWPKADMPVLKYPYDKYKQENEAAETLALQQVETIFKTWAAPIAAVIIEPILSEGGDVHASKSFYQQLRDLTLKYDCLLIFDEVQSGLGATGKLWAHEHFELSTPPDMVTFSKKFQTAGFFYHDPKIIPNDASRMFNTWVGDPARVLVGEGIYKFIQKYDLVNHTKEVGDYLFPKLEVLAAEFPQLMQNLRGKDRGTFIAWDLPDGDARAKFFKIARSQGLNIGGGYLRTVRLRPSLTFNKDHADLAVSLLEKSFQILQKDYE